MPNESSIIIYTTEDGNTSLQVNMSNDTVWLTQAQMADLFQKDQSVIARHISNVFKEGELDKESNMQILHNTLSKYKPTSVYNLDVVISVGYRVKSKRGVIPDICRRRPVPVSRGKSRHVAIPCCEKPFVQRRKQTNCCHAVPVVYGKERYSVQRGRQQENSERHTCRTHIDDSRKPYGGKGCYGEGGCQFDK